MLSLSDPWVLSISGIITLFSVLIASWGIIRKTRAETANLYTEATDRLVKIYEARDKDIQAHIAKSLIAEANCLAQLAIVKQEVQALTQQIKDIK